MRLPLQSESVTQPTSGALHSERANTKATASAARGTWDTLEGRPIMKLRPYLDGSCVHTFCRGQHQTVAVGTVLCDRPPHRSERAGLPHSALALSPDVKPLVGPRVNDSYRWEPAIDEATHS